MDDSFETIKEDAKRGQPETVLPEGFQDEGGQIVMGIQGLIEGRPVLTVASALTATLFAAVTQETLDEQAKEALSVMVCDLATNVLNTNGITAERLVEIMSKRGEVDVHASAIGAILLEHKAEPDQEQG
ncbi:MAG: hypothetical protein ACJ75S_07300 [Solirubrobacterales bacterium]|jgi:hypothetical protein